MVHLLVRFEGHEEKFSFSEDVISLGRVSSNTIQVKDVKASRNHCELRRTGNEWKMVDLESSNGTSVNGEKHNSHVLKPGDVVAIGAFEIVFEPGAVATPQLKLEPKHDTSPLKAEAIAEATALAAVGNPPRSRLVATLSRAVVAAALLVGVLVIVNKIRTSGAEEKRQKEALASAMEKSKAGSLEEAVAALEALIVSNPSAAISKKASDELTAVRQRIARRGEEKAQKDAAAIAEILAAQQAVGASSKFATASAQVDAYLDVEDFAAAADEAKRFRMEFPEGEYADRMAARLRQVMAAAAESWEAIESRANSLTAKERYEEASTFLARNRDRFTGTRFDYEFGSKIAAIQRLSGVTASYVAGASEMSAQAQESLIAVTDLVKARQYAAALKSFDGFVSSLPEKDRAAFAARRNDIVRQSVIFRKLLDTINAGGLASYAIPLGGGVTGKLAEATEAGVTIAFKDETGKGGTTGRKWFQVPGAEMLAYYREIKFTEEERLGLASFCYDNRLALEGAELLQDIVKRAASLEGEVFALIARVRSMGVPADGFIYFERGWYTKTEYTYAKLDYKAKKGAALIAKIEPKPTAEGYAIYTELTGDASLTEVFKDTVKGYYTKALKEKRQAIMKSLQASQSIAAYNHLRKLKEELNQKRAEALRIIYDKTIYPDENHGVEGQPTVDDAVKLVRDMWEQPLKVVAKLDSGIQMLVEAGQQTNEWLAAMGADSSPEELEEYELLLANINESLNLKNICLNSTEKSIREYNLKVWAYNKTAETSMSQPELECIRITNEYREMMGRKILEVDDLLAKTAKGHSTEMVEMGYFAHESPITTRKTPSDRAKLEGYAGGVGENIATGYGDPRAAFLGWYNSSGHHRNMLSDGWNHIGLGCVNGTMWTENLGRAVSHITADSKEKTTGSGRRGGLEEGEPPAKQPPARGEDKKPGEGASVDPGKRAGERGNAPEKPDGKCIGTEPYNPDKDKKQGDDPAPAPDDK